MLKGGPDAIAEAWSTRVGILLHEIDEVEGPEGVKESFTLEVLSEETYDQLIREMLDGESDDGCEQAESYKTLQR